MPKIKETKIIELFNGDKSEDGIEKFIDAVSRAIVDIWSGDDRNIDNCMMTMSTHLLMLHCIQYTQKKEVLENRLQAIREIVLSSIEEIENKEQRATKH